MVELSSDESEVDDLKLSAQDLHYDTMVFSEFIGEYLVRYALYNSCIALFLLTHSDEQVDDSPESDHSSQTSTPP